MIGKISENFGLRLEKEFQIIDIGNFSKERDELTNFLGKRTWDIKNIATLEEKRLNKEIGDKDFFEEFFRYCDLTINLNEKDEYLKSILGANYTLHLLKTMIPDCEYQNGKMEKKLLQGTFAVKEGISVDCKHVYTLDELIKLQHDKKFIQLANNRGYREIKSEEYLDLYDDYMKKLGNLVTFDFDSINNYNYLLLMNTYPDFFRMLREKIDFHVMRDVLKSYNQKLRMIVDNAINMYEEKCKFYGEATEKIKMLRKFL